MTVDEATPAAAAYDEWRGRRWRLTGLTFAILWLVTAAAVGLVGEKRSDLGTLEAAIAGGSVSRVEVVGLPDSPDWRGRARVTLEWRDGLLGRFAEVTVDTRRRPGNRDVGARIVGDPATHLRSYDPDLEVGYRDLTGGRTEWRDWRGPGWAAVLGLAAWFGTFLLATSGPEPWRATRWAWGWLTLFGGPLGSVAYLLLGGPLGVARPADPSRRMTGVWGFLIVALVLGGFNAA